MRKLALKIAEIARAIWRRATATRYTRALEAEVTRLRAENRALLNSILGIAGIPPVLISQGGAISVPVAGSLPAGRASGNGTAPSAASAAAVGRLQSAAPARGRSWRQICRVLESEAVKKMHRQTDNGAEIAVPTRAGAKQ